MCLRRNLFVNAEKGAAVVDSGSLWKLSGESAENHMKV